MMKSRGFTLVELIMVILITGIIATTLTVFLQPAVESYIDSRRRAELTDMADTALRRIAQEVRNAVPNSIRSHGPDCFQFVPTITGGRYRKDVDTVNPGSVPLDTSAATSQFDVLSPMQTLPVIGGWVVINNQNGDDVYTGVNRAAITAVQTAVTPAELLVMQHRLSINPTQFSSGYDGGRFVVVPNAAQTVFYNRVGTTLYRTVAVFGAGAATCNLIGDVLATNVSGTTFVYNPNQGATQQSGFIWMRLELESGADTAALAYGVHVSNVP